MGVDRKYYRNARRLMDKHHQMNFDFLKHLVLVASAVLAVVVSLNSGQKSSSILYYMVLGTLLGAILFGTAGVYILLIQIRKLRKDYAEYQVLHFRDEKMPQKNLTTRYEKLCSFLEYASLISFLSAFFFWCFFRYAHSLLSLVFVIITNHTITSSLKYNSLKSSISSIVFT